MLLKEVLNEQGDMLFLPKILVNATRTIFTVNLTSPVLEPGDCCESPEEELVRTRMEEGFVCIKHNLLRSPHLRHTFVALHPSFLKDVAAK